MTADNAGGLLDVVDGRAYITEAEYDRRYAMCTVNLRTEGNTP